MSAAQGSPVTAAQIAELRELSGAGIMDCKNALEKAGGDREKAKQILKDRGIAIAAKRGGRLAKDGLVGSYIHHNRKVGALVELDCETDFVARTEDFQGLLKELCFQVAALRPQWVSRDEIPAETIAAKTKEFEQEALKENKPAGVAAKIAQGKLEKYLADRCLLEQAHVGDPSGKTRIMDLLTQAAAKMGENVVVRRFVCFQVGGE